MVSAMLLIACRTELPSQSVVGFVAQGSNEQMVIVENDTLAQSVRCAVGEQTIFEGGDLDVGNLIEVIYRPAEREDELPEALLITTDATYSDVLGRWGSVAGGRPYVEFTIKPRGEIQQHSPEDILVLRRWQLAGQDGCIEIIGELSLPPERVKAEDKPKETPDDDVAELPQRRVRSFVVTAQLGEDDDINAESRKTLVLRNNKGRETVLYVKKPSM